MTLVASFDRSLCGKSSPATLLLVSALLGVSVLSVLAETHTVKMVNFAYQPKTLNINAGDTVVWTNTSSSAHDVVSETGAWTPSGLFNRPGTFSVTFANAGNYGYFCTPHKSFGMTGSVVVQAAANQQPSVSLTNPLPGLVLAAPATVVLGASASDPDGTVSSVEFFSDQTSLGSASSPPYSVTVTDLPAGAYSFSARATDNLGLSATSAAVAVSVVNPGAVSFGPNFGVANGEFHLEVSVTPGLRYAIESAGDLSTWLTITNFVATSTQMNFSFPAQSNGREFFRTRLLPNP